MRPDGARPRRGAEGPRAPASARAPLRFARRPARAGLLVEGENCWRIARARRLRFLVDGEETFAAIADALERARHQIWLVGWDFHSEVELRRGAPRADEPGEWPTELVALLDALVRARPSLRANVLAWDFAALYSLEREFLPLLRFGARTHRRVRFAMDGAHPAAASHHQKLVVVDDSIAFVGGLDLTAHRWDTRAHAADEPRRTTPSGAPYGPFHDVQVAVDGEAARAVGALARERWRRATGERLQPPLVRGDAWPPRLEPSARGVRVGIARTVASHAGAPEVREVEALYRDAIRSARRWIYVENQYLTSSRIAGWLAERLEEAGGPEVVVVGPRANEGWLEEGTMGTLRDAVVRRLRAADASGRRLRVLYPARADLPPGVGINVHAKVLVVDDELARVGSANLSNRSMGLDTECDVALVAQGADRTRAAIARFRNDLLAEHLGVARARVAEALDVTHSLVRTIDALGAEGDEARRLRPIEVETGPDGAALVDAIGAVDPEHPAPLEELVERFEQEAMPAPLATGPSPRRRLAGLFAVLAVVAVAALLWTATPLGDRIDAARVAGAVEALRHSPAGLVGVVALFVVASLLLVPVTLTTAATGAALGPWLGAAVSWVGVVLAALAGHAIGRRLWRETVRRVAGARANALNERLARRGVLATVMVRIVPIAPFAVLNLVAGASRVTLRDFALGTAIGTLPGSLVLAFGGDRLRAALVAPSAANVALALLALAAVVGAAFAARRIHARSRGSTGRSAPSP